MAFLSGRRKWFVLGLAAASAVSFIVGQWLINDYWSPLCVKTAVGCGFFAVLQVLPDPKASPTLRRVLSLVALGLLLGAAIAHEHQRELLIELGSTIILFLVLESYLQRKLEALNDQERRDARRWTADVVFELAVGLPVMLEGYVLPSQPDGPSEFRVGDSAAETDATHVAELPRPKPAPPYFGHLGDVANASWVQTVPTEPGVSAKPFGLLFPFPAPKTVGQQLSRAISGYLNTPPAVQVPAEFRGNINDILSLSQSAKPEDVPSQSPETEAQQACTIESKRSDVPPPTLALNGRPPRSSLVPESADRTSHSASEPATTPPKS